MQSKLFVIIHPASKQRFHAWNARERVVWVLRTLVANISTPRTLDPETRNTPKKHKKKTKSKNKNKDNSNNKNNNKNKIKNKKNNPEAPGTQM